MSRIFVPEPSAASARLLSLTAALTERGCQVNVLTTSPPRSQHGDDTAAGARVWRWPVLRDREGYVRGYLPYLSFDVPLFFRVLFGPRADVYVVEPPPTTGVSARVAAWLRRRPYVYYAADIWSDASATVGAPTLVLRVVRMMESFAMRGAAHILAVSEGVRDRVEHLAPGTTVSVVGHGVDTELFSSEGWIPEEAADVVYAGTASEWHGAEIAMEALAEVMSERPELRAAFIGQGSSWLRLQEIARDSGVGDRVRFLSAMPPEEVAGWLRGARLSLATLVPGQGYDFAVPTKIYSSLATGTPVVYAGPDPVARLIRENHLGWSSAYDRDAMAAQIRDGLGKQPAQRAGELRRWVQENVSARRVASAGASVIIEASACSGSEALPSVE